MIEKHVIIHQFNPEKTFSEIAVKMQNVPGVLASVLGKLSSLGVNVLSGYTAANEGQEIGVWCSFIENRGVEEAHLRSALESLPGVIEVFVETSKEGLVMDVLSFPLVWNTGERAILLGQERFAKMLDRLREAFGMAGDLMVYQEGLSVGEGLSRFFVSKMGEKFVRNHLSQIFGVFQAAGAGYIEDVQYELDNLRVSVKIKESIECLGHRSSTHYSEFMRGLIAGFVSTVTGSRVRCEEVSCIATGDDSCEFVVTAR